MHLFWEAHAKTGRKPAERPKPWKDDCTPMTSSLDRGDKNSRLLGKTEARDTDSPEGESV